MLLLCFGHQLSSEINYHHIQFLKECSYYVSDISCLFLNTHGFFISILPSSMQLTWRRSKMTLKTKSCSEQSFSTGMSFRFVSVMSQRPLQQDHQTVEQHISTLPVKQCQLAQILHQEPEMLYLLLKIHTTLYHAYLPSLLVKYLFL